MKTNDRLNRTPEPPPPIEPHRFPDPPDDHI
jgi:hypothetical protein